jgi:hypothetical protein
MRFFTSLLSLILLISLAQGQGVLKRLEDRAKQKTAQRLEQKVDEKMDRALDRVLDGKPQSSSTSDTTSSNPNSNDANTSKTMQNIQGRIMKKAMGGSSCNAQASYSFQHDYTMEMTSTDKKGNEEVMKIKIYLGSDISLMAYEILSNSESPDANGSKVIMNGKDSSMIMLVNAGGMKTGMCNKNYVPTSAEEVEQTEDAQNAADGWTKTGRTKVILGKTCYEHVRIEGTVTQTAWMANDGETMSETFKAMQQNNAMGMASISSPFGTLMEMTQTDSKTKETMVIQMVEINENKPSTISTQGYTMY